MRFAVKYTKYTSRILNGFDEEGAPIYNDEVQREIENSRVNKIADFLIEDPEATFPTNIVLHIPLEAIEKQIEEGNLVKIFVKDEVFSENIWEKIEVESSNDDLLPFLLTIPLQKLAYYSALKKGYDIDKPRNLAKSVTVE